MPTPDQACSISASIPVGDRYQDALAITASSVPDHTDRVRQTSSVEVFSMVLTFSQPYHDIITLRSMRPWETEPSPNHFRRAGGFPGSHGPGRAL